ncbi:uncharacterized protein M421DRAFT_191706 [Didymella exigua CBS 183.55]|uniref:Uncharacterized protein n=1 Tax=Didymella exigua CBS 183.55 TaxID=1150837 RepID=A0A6A5S1Q1_9PLEO|nr:uncharacterized protein M421DRAFT_191706 [Didymella exigua CBS 183.55]KAF1933208.1 hypothetical protein M421DRAFT_191706 [Didymella exigua CBS 183.55]
MEPAADISRFPSVHDPHTADTLLSKSLASAQVYEVTNSTPSPQPVPSPGCKNFVLNPSLITSDFDALRFKAAAYNQLPFPDSRSATPISGSDSDSYSPSPAHSNLLISSPYNNPGHYLDLLTLPLPSRLFALALTALRPVHDNYVAAAFTQSLDFDAVLGVLRQLVVREEVTWKETSFYVVLFRSQLRQGVDQEWLYKLDYESHREACESGGLLKYWFGKADLEGERRNLATCFWHSREDAYKGGLGPWHKKARQAGRELYESIVFSTHRFTIMNGAEEYRFEDWRD